MHFQIACLAILSVSTLCLKDLQIGNDTIHPELLLTVGVIRWKKVDWVSAIQKQETITNPLLFYVQTAYSRTRERERERRERERERERERIYKGL